MALRARGLVRPNGLTSARVKQPIERRVLREVIKDHLIDAILRGVLKAGDRIVETRIAQELGVSQTPVREALRDLELLGFVVSAPFRGTQVRAFTGEELVQIYPIRAAIEGIAARAAARQMTEAQFSQLQDQLDQMRQAAAAGDATAFVAANVAFHRIFVEASGNRMLHQIWTSMSLATTTFLTATVTHRPLDELASRHEAILVALRVRDPEAAEVAMRRHIEEPGRWVLHALLTEKTLTRQSRG